MPVRVLYGIIVTDAIKRKPPNSDKVGGELPKRASKSSLSIGQTGQAVKEGISMDKLEGLELRKAALEAAGWAVVKDMVTYTDDGIPEGPEPHYLFNEKTGEMGLMYFTDIDAWQHAPAVESSVDAALQWLTLGDTCGWQIHWPMADTDSPAGQVTIMNYQNRRTYSALFRTNAADAMCRAYLQYKAGA